MILLPHESEQPADLISYAQQLNDLMAELVGESGEQLELSARATQGLSTFLRMQNQILAAAVQLADQGRLNVSKIR